MRSLPRLAKSSLCMLTFLAAAPATAGPECALAAPEIFTTTEASVVQVFSMTIDPFRVSNRVRSNTGSAIVLADDLAVTNFHVIKDATVVGIQLDGVFIKASIVGRDPVLDIAVLRAEGLSRATTPIKVEQRGPLLIGEATYIVGYPLGIGKSLTAGLVSAVSRLLPRTTFSWMSPFIQTSAAVSPGNSGSALLDDCGRLIGMITLSGMNPLSENLNFAIPTKTLMKIVDELVATGKVARPWHGIYGQMVTPTAMYLMGAPLGTPAQGFLVETVEPGSAADRAGVIGGDWPVLWGTDQLILGGDVITHVNGVPILTYDDAVNAVNGLEIGQKVVIDLLRNGTPMQKSAVIDERPIMPQDLAIYDVLTALER